MSVECKWDPSKHDGQPCPIHGAGGSHKYGKDKQSRHYVDDDKGNRQFFAKEEDARDYEKRMNEAQGFDDDYEEEFGDIEYDREMKKAQEETARKGLEAEDLDKHKGQDRYEAVANILDNMVGPGGYERGVAKLKDLGINVPDNVLAVDMNDDAILVGFNKDGSEEIWKYDVNNQKEFEENDHDKDGVEKKPYKIGTKFAVKNPFIKTTDNYEITNIGQDYVGVIGPGGVFQRIPKEDFEEQFFNKRLKEDNEGK